MTLAQYGGGGGASYPDITDANGQVIISVPLQVDGLITGGTHSPYGAIDLNNSSSNVSLMPGDQTNNRLDVGIQNILGSNDVVFQGVHAATTAYTYLEDAFGAGLVLGTGGAAKPIIFRVNRNTVATIDPYGHLALAGPGIGTPTIAAGAQGTSPALDAGSSDQRGGITVSSTATSGALCTLTFTAAWSTAPFGFLTSRNAATLAHVYVSAVTTTSITFSHNLAAITALSFSYLSIG